MFVQPIAADLPQQMLVQQQSVTRFCTPAAASASLLQAVAHTESACSKVAGYYTRIGHHPAAILSSQLMESQAAFK